MTLTDNFVRLMVRQSTYNKVMLSCYNEFFNHHKSLDGKIKKTHDFIVDRIADYYIEGGIDQ